MEPFAGENAEHAYALLLDTRHNIRAFAAVHDSQLLGQNVQLRAQYCLTGPASVSQGRFPVRALREETGSLSITRLMTR